MPDIFQASKAAWQHLELFAAALPKEPSQVEVPLASLDSRHYFADANAISNSIRLGT
jgi:hypothetical protein